MPDDVAEEEKTRRIVALQSLQKDIQVELFTEAIGRTLDVLVDSRSRRREWELSGRTSGNTVVNLAGDASLDRPDGSGADHRREPEQPARGGRA